MRKITGGAVLTAAFAILGSVQDASASGWVQLPRSGPGFKTHTSADRQWGQARMINGLQALGRFYNYAAGRGNTNYGDISKYGGGYFPPHSSHRNGTDCDMSMMNNAGVAQPGLTIYGGYSPYYTGKLVWCMRNMREWSVRCVLFNGRISGVSWYTGHDNHLHLGIY